VSIELGGAQIAPNVNRNTHATRKARWRTKHLEHYNASQCELMRGSARKRHTRTSAMKADLEDDCFCTGAQIRAARALLGWRRCDLAKAARIHRNAVAYWERHDDVSIYFGYGAPERIVTALEKAGVQLISEPGKGVVRLPRKRRP
jgi:hypothetical protein